MRLSDMMKKQGIEKQAITAALEAELQGISLADKELATLEKEDISFDEITLEGKDLIIYSYNLGSAYRLKRASMKDIDRLANAIPGMVVIVLKE